jgi:hypothetical protein
LWENWLERGQLLKKKGVAYGKIILKARREKVHLNNGKSSLNEKVTARTY